MMRRTPRSTLSSSSAASDVYKRQLQDDVLVQAVLSHQDRLRDLHQQLCVHPEPVKGVDGQFSTETCSLESLLWAHVLVNSRAMNLSIDAGFEDLLEKRLNLDSREAPAGVGAVCNAPLVMMPFIDMANHTSRGGVCHLRVAEAGE
eukprot:TRINITY_DN8668_c0_g1_i2.p1 TRINITY_DN8668_c0_g1~~TRINITY_DN8668_c0_g1_i2.p1  ORF type:complete len:146 (+),score=36.97 TRINITY_DN8668_c0_g1_i2:36-473(+)